MTPNGATIFCMNLRFGLADDGPNGWPHRKDLIFQLIRSYPADFYAFQEVNDFQARDLQTVLPQYGIIGERPSAPLRWQNNPIFYHPDWRCDQSQHFYLSDTPHIPSQYKESKWPRQCTMGLFTATKKQLILINTHFDFDPDVQVKSARLIQDQLMAHPLAVPAILTGDFNATPADPCYDIFAGDPPGNLAGQSFANIFEPPYPSTFHGFTGQAQGGMIDWILYRGDINPKKTKIISDSFNNRYPSDHFPLLAWFEWSP